MSDKFDGSDHVDLQPGDANVPKRFRFKACSASTANDGSIPYGSTISNSTILAHFGGDTSVTSTAIPVARSLTSNSVTVYLSHSSTTQSGLYHLVIKNTISLSGSTRVMTRQYDYDRVYVKDR